MLHLITPMFCSPNALLIFFSTFFILWLLSWLSLSLSHQFDAASYRSTLSTHRFIHVQLHHYSHALLYQFFTLSIIYSFQFSTLSNSPSLLLLFIALLPHYSSLSMLDFVTRMCSPYPPLNPLSSSAQGSSFCLLLWLTSLWPICCRRWGLSFSASCGNVSALRLRTKSFVPSLIFPNSFFKSCIVSLFSTLESSSFLSLESWALSEILSNILLTDFSCCVCAKSPTTSLTPTAPFSWSFSSLLASSPF